MLSSSFYVFIVHTFLNECLRLCRVLGIQMCLVNNSTHTAVHIPSIRWQHLLSQPCGVVGHILRRPEMERTLGNGLGYTNTPAYKHNTSPVHFGASLWVWLGGICTIMPGLTGWPPYCCVSLCHMTVTHHVCTVPDNGFSVPGSDGSYAVLMMPGFLLFFTRIVISSPLSSLSSQVLDLRNS